jgi:hypothetical protein
VRSKQRNTDDEKLEIKAVPILAEWVKKPARLEQDHPPVRLRADAGAVRRDIGEAYLGAGADKISARSGQLCQPKTSCVNQRFK